MANTRKIGLTFAQMLVGCCAGLLAGGVSLLLINLLWRGIESVHLGGFLMALLVLISFLIVYGATVAATAEGVRQMGRFMPRQTSRRNIYEGSFLGACAGVAILAVTRSDWIGTLQEWGGPVRLLGTLVYYVIVTPVKFATYWIPPLLLLLIAAPIGAAIGYNTTPSQDLRKLDQNDSDSPSASKETETDGSEEQSLDRKRRI